MKRGIYFFFTTFLLSSCGLFSSEDDKPNDKPYSLEYPSFYPIPEIPSDNPLTEKGVELGRKLFNDPILSYNNTISCASCHQEQFNFSDDKIKSIGVDGKQTDVHSMTLTNVLYYKQLFWNGRVNSLEQQATLPIEHPNEMNQPIEQLIEKLKAKEEYVELFEIAFGENSINKTNISKALAQFQRTLISKGIARFDTFLSNRNPAIFSKEEFEGYRIFFSEKGDCFHCHGGELGTNFKFENNGLFSDISNKGLGAITGNKDSLGMFQVPSLRNISRSAPYMHDGRFSTLEEVIEHYNSGLKDSPTLHPKLKIKYDEGGMQLNPTEIQQLIAFLKTMDDPIQ
jgi:cytochrome c peroxidase